MSNELTTVQNELLIAQIQQIQQDLSAKNLGQNIEQSIKLSKQVLIKQLEAAHNEARDAYEEAYNKVNEFFDRSNPDYREAESKYNFELEYKINSNPELTHLRQSLNLFIEYSEDHVTENWSFVGSSPTFENYLELLYEALVHNTEISLVELEVCLDISYETRFHSSRQIEMNIQFVEPIEGAASLVDHYKYLVENRDKAAKALADTKSKINNIDGVMEELEAKLLADQLAKSEQGQAVLGMATDLINGHIGEGSAINLLEKKDV